MLLRHVVDFKFNITQTKLITEFSNETLHIKLMTKVSVLNVSSLQRLDISSSGKY